jgi:DNA (cytosine-5)-methyltransferase 1
MNVTFADICSGIGGFHLAMQAVGGTCVMACEIDSFARKTYEANFKVSFFPNDITTLYINDIPDFNVLCAGFPCQPFSQAGFKKGFDDTRGTLFFSLAKILGSVDIFI